MLYLFVLSIVQFCFTKINPVAINLHILHHACLFSPRCEPSPPAVSHCVSKPLASVLCTDGSLTHFPLLALFLQSFCVHLFRISA